jgi:hypothetical protein
MMIFGRTVEERAKKVHYATLLAFGNATLDLTDMALSFSGKKTEDGLSVYTEDELKIGRGGGAEWTSGKCDFLD